MFLTIFILREQVSVTMLLKFSMLPEVHPSGPIRVGDLALLGGAPLVKRAFKDFLQRLSIHALEYCMHDKLPSTVLAVLKPVTLVEGAIWHC
jgi:hypothetical protein